jgi:hypothetical protein
MSRLYHYHFAAQPFLFNQGGWTIAYVTQVKRPRSLRQIALAPLLAGVPFTDFIVIYERETNSYVQPPGTYYHR